MSPQRQASNRSEEKADVGVLFIHGIGVQGRGATVVEFGEPVWRWIRDWFDGLQARWLEAGMGLDNLEIWVRRMEPSWRRSKAENLLAVAETLNRLRSQTEGKRGDGRPLGTIGRSEGLKTLAGHVSVADAKVRNAEPDVPSHAALEITRLDADGGVRASRWLLAESWWAETFPVPAFGSVVAWGRKVFPYTVGAHFGAQVYRAWKRLGSASGVWDAVKGIMRLGASIGFLVLGLILSVLTLIVLVGLRVVALLPIPSVRGFVATVQRQLSASVGDSFVLLASPIQAGAILGQVRRDLRWLADRCGAVILVGHSQGGAIAHLAVREGGHRKLKALLTFGSGLRKLEELRLVMERGSRLSWGALLVLWGLVAVGVGVPQLFVPGLNKALWISWVLLWSGVLLLGMVGVALPIRSPELNWWIGELKARGLRWEDYYASADPVPNGPVPENDPGPPPYPISEPVHNRASLWRDHTTYWQNRDEFVTAVVRAVSRHDEALGGTLPGHEDLFDHAVKRRAWRVQALALGRTIAWLSGAAVIFRHWPAWSSALVWGGRRAAAPLAALFGRDVAQRPFPGGEMALAAGTLAVVFVAYLIAARLWRDWSEEEVEAFFRRAKSELPPIAFVVGLGLQGAVAGVLVIPGVRAELWGLWMVIIAVVFSLWFAWREPRAKRAQPQAPTKTRSSRPRT